MAESAKILMSDSILESALSLFENRNFYSDEEYLCNILNLSLFLEKLILHDKIYIRDFPEVSCDVEIDNQGNIIKDEIYADPSEFLEKKIKEDPILHPLFDNLDSHLKIIRPGINSELERVFRQSQELERNTGDFEPYVSMKIQEIKYALNNNYSYIPYNNPYSNRAIEYVNYINQIRTEELLIHYEQLSVYLKSELQKLVNYGRPSTIFLPPLASIVFERAKRFEDIIPITFELKEEFSSLRDIFSKYEKDISDDSLSIKDSLNSINELQNSISGLYPQSEDSVLMQIHEWRDLADIGVLIDGISTSDAGSLSKMLLGQPLKVLANKIKNRKVGYLYKVKNEFLSIKSYSKLTDKFFKKEITSKHIDEALRNGWGKSILKNNRS